MRLYSLFVLPLALSFGCSRSEPDAPRPAGTPGELPKETGELNQPIARSEPAARHGRWARELAELNQQIASLPYKDLDADRKAIVKWLRTRPEYEASGESRLGNAWARFTDGRMVMIPFVPPGMRGGSPDSSVDPTDAAPPAQDRPPTGTSEVRYLLPALRQARLLNTDFVGREKLRSPVALLKEYLGPAGYTAVERKATVAALKAVQGDGIFYIDTHGGSWPNRQKQEVFALAASPGSEASEEDLEGDLESGRLIYVVWKASGPGYAITAQFVRQYMSFGENAFVFINACGSESNEAFRKAFFDKGAAFYAGWTQLVGDDSANIVAKFLFDRLLGANLFSRDREDPKQRPFEYMNVWIDMQQRQYDVDRFQRRDDPDFRGAKPLVPAPSSPGRDPRAQLRIHSADPTQGHGGLRPTIVGLVVDEVNEELLITGTFGTTPDEVTLGGKPLNVKQFVGQANDLVICALPASGEGSAGPAIVKVHGKVSNAVPLTEWRVRFRYTEDVTDIEPPLKKTAVIDIHLRQDVHAFRIMPHSTPMALPPGPLRELFAANDSKVQWKFSGAGKHKVTPERHYALSGSGTMTSGEGLADPQKGFSFSGQSDPSKKAFFKTRLFALIINAGITRVTGPASEYDEEAGLSFESPETDMSLDANLGIRAGSVTWELDNQKTKLEWDDAPARFAPTADTLARAMPGPDRDETAAAATASRVAARSTAKSSAETPGSAAGGGRRPVRRLTITSAASDAPSREGWNPSGP